MTDRTEFAEYKFCALMWCSSETSIAYMCRRVDADRGVTEGWGER